MKIDMDWSPVHLKPLLDYLKKVSEEEYKRLSPFFSIGVGKPRDVLLKSGGIEIESRFILEGMVGKFYLGQLIRLYVQGDVCVDLESYSSQVPSRYEFKVLQKVKYTRLGFKNANLILEEYPQFQELSDELYRLLRYRDEEWQVILKLPFEQARTVLNSSYPGFESILTQKQLADLLGVDRKTIARYNKKEHEKAKFSRIIRYYNSNLKYPFESKLHRDVDKLDLQTLVWGSTIHRIFSGTKDENLYKKRQWTWLSARLYPEASWENINWLARLYALLFAMDDFTDRLPNGLKGEVWGEVSCAFYGVLNGNNCMVLSKSIMAYRNAFFELWTKLPKLVSKNLGYLEYLREETQAYLKSNSWEANNKDGAVIPSMEDYLAQRPYFSGGQLALSLSPLGMSEPFGEIRDAFDRSAEIRRLAAKLIYLTNDLFSYEKEKKLGDFHNLMILKIHHDQLKEDQAREIIIEVHRNTLEEFLQKSQAFLADSDVGNTEIVKQINYKVSGVVNWSLYDTNRYLNLLDDDNNVYGHN